MRWRFQAIDGGGRVVRGVLAAETEDEAREMLLGENVFPKRLEPADLEEKVTWAPKERIKSRITAGQTTTRAEEQKIVRAKFPTTCISGFDDPVPGEAGLAEDGTFIFHAKGRDLHLAPDQIEVAAISGFPARILRITLLNGKMYEFNAGLLLASSAAKSIARSLR